MQLPRYPIARSATSELQSGRASLVTPAEVARTEMAKMGAVASVSDAVTKVLDVEARARAEEEYTDAVFDYESKLQEYDIEVSTRGFEVDDNDNIIVDDQDIVKEELAHRKTIADEARESMTSGLGKRQFDDYMMQSNLRRNQQYTQQAVSRRVKALGAQAEHKVDTLILEGKHDLAMERARKGAEDGVIGQDKFDAMKLRISRAKSEDSITGVLKTGTAAEMQTFVVALEEGKLPDGSDAMLTGDEEYAYTTKLNARINSIDDDAFGEVERAREEQYMDLLPEVLSGNVPVEDLRRYRYILDDKRYDKLVGYAITASRRPSDSDPQVKDEYETRIREIRAGYGYKHTLGGFQESVYDVVDAMALDPNLSGSDVDLLTSKLEGYVKTVRDNPELEDLLDVEITKITGRKVDQISVMIEGADKTNMIVASRLERDFKDYIVDAYRGKRFAVDDAKKWLDENVSKYHVQVQKALLKGYKMPEPPMLPDGSVDVNGLGVQMLKFQMQKVGVNERNGEMYTEEQARVQAEYDFQSYIRLIEAG